MTISLFEQIQTIYRQHDNAALLVLLDSVAKQLRTTHDDTNLALPQRAQALAAIRLPDDYWRIFKHMYWHDAEVPVDFQLVADQYRAQLEKQHGVVGMSEQNIWLWDDKTAQPMVVLNQQSKKRYRSKWRQLQQLWRVLWALPKVWWCYRKIVRQSFAQTVTLTNRIGIALQADQAEHELPLLVQLQNIPVLLRLARHETEIRWQTTITLIEKLHMQGNRVAVALLQDREAILHPEKWRVFLQSVIPKIYDKTEWLEVGHAINRVKWGIWEISEYCQLVKIAFEFKAQYPKLRFVGPAVIDFEWYRVIDVLRALPQEISFYGLSQHLYVDRRGAPENYQGKFSTLEKCAMGKAMASAFDCDGRYIISEMNWPLQDTGIWSPIGSPYTAPEWFRDRPGVTEEEYANYLIRYLAICLCSGHVEQVFIWRLTAHGFGLVDDQDQWRLRPAFFALKQFINILGNSTFVERVLSDTNSYLLQFQREQQKIILAWVVKDSGVVKLPFVNYHRQNYIGEIELVSEIVTLTEQPSYFFEDQSVV
jgi:hypothetical protein